MTNTYGRKKEKDLSIFTKNNSGRSNFGSSNCSKQSASLSVRRDTYNGQPDDHKGSIQESGAVSMNPLQKLSLRWNTDFFIAYKNQKGNWSKWILLSEWNRDYSPNYRQILKEELVIESDLTQKENKIIANQIIASMKEKGVGFFCSFTGNKSYHNHSFWEGLNELRDKQRTKAKELLAEWICGKQYKQVDAANFKPKRLILIHGEKHPKTGKKKVLFDSFQPEKVNIVPEEILEKAKEVQDKVFESNVCFKPSSCSFIDYALKNKLPISDRNSNLVPNVVALLDEKGWEQCATTQDKTFNEFENWAKRKPSFNCEQLRRYAKSVGKGNLCNKCLMEVGINE